MTVALALLRGAAVGVVGAVAIFAALVIAGVVEGTSNVVFLAGAMSGALVGLSKPGVAGLGVVGAVLVGVMGLAAGVITGFGMLEYSAIAASALTALWLGTGERRPSEVLRWFRWGGVVALVLALVLLPLILEGGTLGHDESAYALKGREWLEGTPGTGWRFHRGVGMSVYAYVVLALGGSEAGLRFLGLAGVMGLAAGAWALGRRMGNATVGAIASVAVVAAPALLRRSTEYLSDVPSAALLTLTMVIVWRELHDRDLPSYRLLWALPPAWAAFYLRYQSALSLGLIALTVLVLWWPKLRRRPGPAVWLVVLGAIGLIPHLILSTELTGSPWGIVLDSSGLVGSYPGEGLVDYASQFLWALAGWVGPIALVLALGGTVIWWRDRGSRERNLFLVVPASLQALVLGIVAHGDPRFLFFPISLVVVAGAITAHRLLAEGSRPWGHALGLGLAVLVIGSLALSAVEARSWVSNRAANNESVELAAEVVETEAEDATCAVMTSYQPQVTFYSGCYTAGFRPSLGPGEAVSRLTGDARFLVLIENGKRQPVGEDLESLLALTDGPPVTVSGEGRSGLVYRFAE